MDRLSSTLIKPRPITSSKSMRAGQINPNNILLTGRSTDSSISTNKSRASLPGLISNDEKDNIARIKPLFRTLLENVSTFVSHNGSTPSIRSKMEQSLTDVDRYFTGFYNQLNKSGGTTVSVAKLQTQGKLTPMIKNTAMPFIKSWAGFVFTIKDIEQTGLDLISNSIDDNFNFILNSLDNVLKGEGYNSGMHDPVIKQIKKFQQQIWTFQGLIGKFILMSQSQKIKTEEKISQDLKSFSRDLSSTFSTDFANYAIHFPENERTRNLAYNAVCDIISQIKSTIVYDEDVKKIDASLEPLLPTFEIIATNLNLLEVMRTEEREKKQQKRKQIQKDKKEAQQQQTQQTHQSISPEKEEVDNYFNKDLEINDLIDRAFIAFKRPNLTIDRVKEFFEALRGAVGKLQEKNENLQRQIADKDQQLQFSESFKERLTQETQKVATLRASLQASQDRIKNLEDQLHYKDETGNVDGLRRCMKNVLNFLRARRDENADQKEDLEHSQEHIADLQEEAEFLQNIGKPNKQSDNYMIENVNKLLNDPNTMKCKKCEEFDSFYFKLSRILGSSTVLEEAQSLVKRANASAKAEGKLQQEIAELRKEKADLTASLAKILDTFGVSAPSVEMISQFAVQSVGDEIGKLNAKIKRQEEDKKCERDMVAKRISDLFGVNKQENIYQQLDEVKMKFSYVDTTVEQYKNSLEEAETRLILYLGTKKQGRPTIESVKSLLTELETRQNPLQSVVDTLKREIMESTESLVDCERTISRITRDKLPDLSSMKLDQRIQRLGKILRTIE